jgi:hypothetical protein
VGAVYKGSNLPAQHISGGMKGLDERQRCGCWRQRPGFAIRRANAIEHTSPEFRAGFEAHVRRVE